MRVTPVLRCSASAVVPLTAVVATVLWLQSPSINAQNSIFNAPERRQQAERQFASLQELLAKKDYTRATFIARQIHQLMPTDPEVNYLLARCLSLRGDQQKALVVLKQAADAGFTDFGRIDGDEELKRLRDQPGYTDIRERALKTPPGSLGPNGAPAPIEDGGVVIREKNAVWDSGRNCIRVEFEEPVDRNLPVVEGSSDADREVIEWYREGTAAGNVGDFYDNRDRDHSLLNLSRFPQLTNIEYSEEAQACSADYGVQLYLYYNRPTLGNSSTAHVGSPFWRSNPRRFMHSESLTRLIYNQYVSNMVYFYPEHNDYDPEHGDVFPANTPYCVISQGSSGSDRQFMDAFALTMAALRPEVKDIVKKQGLLPPLLQMIFRRSQKQVTSDETYLTGIAHPVVFAGSQMDELRMVRLAHEITPNEIPPLVRMDVVEEDQPLSGTDFFFPAPNERLFDTHGAIARVHRTSSYWRRMVIDVSETISFNRSRPKFHWAVLQGPPDLVKINPLNSDFSRVEILFPWCPEVPIPGRTDMTSRRIDVGVFASTGKYWSVPGLVCSMSLRREKRIYDDNKRIISIDYADPETSQKYDDIVLDVRKNWKDTYQYDPDGTLLGWTRTAADTPPAEFNAIGHIITDRNPDGSTKTSRVDYRVIPSANEQAKLEYFPSEE